MKKILLGLIALSFSTIPAYGASVHGGIRTYEETYNTDIDMYQMIYVEDLKEALKDLCSPPSIQIAEGYAHDLRQQFLQESVWMNDAKELEFTYNWYNTLKDLQDDIYKYEGETFCSLKYVLYDIQDYLRERHLELLEENNLFKDFDGFGDDLYGVELKVQLLDMLIDRVEGYEEKLGRDLGLTIDSSAIDKDALSSDKKHLLARIEELMIGTIYKAFYSQMEAGLLDESDLDKLDDTVKLEITNSCGVFHGKYEIKETSDGNGNILRYDTLGMVIRLNFCTNYFVLREIDKVFEQVVHHELAHHFYYYRDESRDQFMSICWNGTNKKNSCGNNDFVSEYAMSLPQEDYAEHFMYRFLGLPVQDQSMTVTQKFDHFDRVMK